MCENISVLFDLSGCKNLFYFARQNARISYRFFKTLEFLKIFSKIQMDFLNFSSKSFKNFHSLASLAREFFKNIFLKSYTLSRFFKHKSQKFSLASLARYIILWESSIFSFPLVSPDNFYMNMIKLEFIKNLVSGRKINFW